MLEVKIVHGRPSKPRAELVAKFMQRTFGPCRELDRYYKWRGKDEVLRRITRRFRGVRLVGVTSLWECLVWSIIGQQISVYAAFAVRSRVTKLAGAQVKWKGQLYEGFPTPESFLKLSADELRGAGFSRPKADYALRIADVIARGELGDDSLRALPLPAAREKLLALKGIGPWSAEYAMMRLHLDADSCPYEDIGLRNAVGREYGLGRQATMKEVETISESWRPFRAYATFYLWQTLL